KDTLIGVGSLDMSLRFLTASREVVQLSRAGTKRGREEPAGRVELSALLCEPLPLLSSAKDVVLVKSSISNIPSAGDYAASAFPEPVARDNAAHTEARTKEDDEKSLNDVLDQLRNVPMPYDLLCWRAEHVAAWIAVEMNLPRYLPA